MDINIKIYRNISSPVFYMGVNFGFSHEEKGTG
jgi:hypothetical protein